MRDRETRKVRDWQTRGVTTHWRNAIDDASYGLAMTLSISVNSVVGAEGGHGDVE